MQMTPLNLLCAANAIFCRRDNEGHAAVYDHGAASNKNLTGNIVFCSSGAGSATADSCPIGHAA